MPYPLDRRTLLKAAGVSIGLPLLEAMVPSGRAAEQQAVARGKRLLLIARPLGLHSPHFFPEQPGAEYSPSRYLRLLQEHRRDFTVFSGMSHRGYNAGHGSEVALYTGVGPEGMRPGDVRNTISLDQEVATRIGGETRFASLVLGGGSLSWNRKGVQVPSESSATRTFKALFIDGTPAEVAREMEKIQSGQSILDGVRDQSRTLAKRLSPADQRRVELLLTSIREAEQRLQQDQAWVLKPKPKVEAKPITEDHLTDGKMLERARQWFDLAHLALQTNSTRVISLHLYSHAERLDLPGLSLTHHDASHHGQDDGKIQQLAMIEEAELKLFADLLTKLRGSHEPSGTLLDQTVICYASNLGNASAHTNDNLPILLAGGGFKHAGHVAFDRKNNEPFSNLFVRMLRQMDLEFDRFGSSTRTLSEV